MLNQYSNKSVARKYWQGTNKAAAMYGRKQESFLQALGAFIGLLGSLASIALLLALLSV